MVIFKANELAGVYLYICKDVLTRGQRSSKGTSPEGQRQKRDLFGRK